MASLFGSMATEFGGTLKDMAQDKREERLANEEALREMQLEKQRMAHQAKLTQKRIDADDRRETRRQEYQTAQYAIELGDRRTDAQSEREWRGSQNEADRYSRETIALINAYDENLSGSGIKTKGWSIKTDMVQSINEDGQLVSEPVFIASKEGDPTAWMQEGSFMFRGGDRQHFDSVLANKDTAYMNDRDARAKVEQVLMQNLGNKQVEADFERKYGYLPSEYLSALTMQHDPNIREWVEKNRSPAYDVSGRLTPRPGGGGGSGSAEVRGGVEGTRQYPPAAPMRNVQIRPESGVDAQLSPEELARQPTLDQAYDTPERAAHIAKHGTHEERVERLRQEEGGKLTQGQAAAGELEQGGQIDEVKVNAQMQPGPVPDIMKPVPEEPRAAGGGRYLDKSQWYGPAWAQMYNQSPLAQRVFPVGAGAELSDEEAAALAEQVAAEAAIRTRGSIQ